MKRLIPAALTVTACSQEPTVQEQLQQEAERRVQAEQQRIQSLREKNPEVNWMMISITAGKYSEDIEAEVYRTYDECRQIQPWEDTECVPIAALPESYWTTK